MKNKQTYLTILAVIVSVVAPILFAEGYTGEVPAEWAPIAAGLTAFISIVIRWYKERDPKRAERLNL
ncbi:MAG: hypothetical protein H8D67_30940 [Deltaproteobacteria bacterium]|nr:hypothetical protein [Deltaproteobacteria bacterium]